MSYCLHQQFEKTYIVQWRLLTFAAPMIIVACRRVCLVQVAWKTSADFLLPRPAPCSLPVADAAAGLRPSAWQTLGRVAAYVGAHLHMVVAWETAHQPQEFDFFQGRCWVWPQAAFSLLVLLDHSSWRTKANTVHKGYGTNLDWQFRRVPGRDWGLVVKKVFLWQWLVYNSDRVSLKVHFWGTTEDP